MNCTVQYTDDKQINALIRAFSGTVSAKDIVNSWNHIFNNKLLNKNHIGVISNYLHTDLQIEKDDYRYFHKFFLDNLAIFGKLKLVQVIDSPKIVLPMIWSLDFDKINSESFSTLEEAKNWIILPKG